MIHSQSDCRYFCWATAFIFHDGVFQRCRPTFQPQFFQRHLFQPQGGSRYIVNVFNLCIIHAHKSADPCFCSSRGGAQATTPCSSHLFPLLRSCFFWGFSPDAVPCRVQWVWLLMGSSCPLLPCFGRANATSCRPGCNLELVSGLGIAFSCWGPQHTFNCNSLGHPTAPSMLGFLPKRQCYILGNGLLTCPLKGPPRWILVKFFLGVW